MIKENMLKNELNLSKYAVSSSDAIRINEEQENIRPAYFRDIDRIIYSLSYSRYSDKTQVFSNNENDHISRRIIHVQFVSKIARTIGRALNLNEDLIEAISLGHDIGHVPFGHAGEKILNEISLRNNEGFFMHNVQSVRTLMYIENNGLGKNLTIQVLDGILCHNGESLEGKYQPVKKSKAEFINDYLNCYKEEHYDRKLHSMTLEGCVVRISDVIGYIGRDIEDAIRLGIIKQQDIPNEIRLKLGNDNREIINTIVMDIINNSINKPYITMSEETFEALEELKNFNYKYIYDKANTKEQLDNYKIMFETIFDYNLNILKNNDKNKNIYKIYLNSMNELYLKNNSLERIVIDYIAGMTDDYFIREYNKIKK